MSDQSPLTREECERLEWCLSILEEENALECRNEAVEIAYKEFYAAEAYQELLPLLASVWVHELQKQAGGGVR